MRTRNRSFGRVAAAFALMLSVGLLVGQLPAAANHAAPTGNVDIKDTLAGELRTFRLTVNHPPGPPGGLPIVDEPEDTPDINVVDIRPPADLITPTTVSGPGTWQGQIIMGPTPRIVFQGGTIPPGGNVTFDIQSAVERPAADDQENWVVLTSSNGGQSFRQAPSNNLSTLVRVLQTQAVSIVSPNGATNNSVTATQSDVCVRSRVHNAGSAALDVTPSLGDSASRVTIISRHLAAGTPCSGPELAGGSATIPSLGTQEFDFKVSFGNAGSTTITAGATAPGANGYTTNVGVSIQPIALLTYVGGSVSPRALPGGTPGVNFSLRVNKGPSGSPAVQLDPSQTTFEFDACQPPRQLTGDSSVGAGVVNNRLFEYQACNVADIADGSYEVTATYAYTDANDFVVGLTEMNVTDLIRLDNLLPFVDPSIIAPPNQVSDQFPRAVTNNQPFDVNIKVFDQDPEDGEMKPCGTGQGCVIEEAHLQAYDGGGNPLGDPIPVNANNNASGNVTVSVSTVFPTGSEAVQLFAAVRDEAGHVAENLSEEIEVDLIPPFITEALTGRTTMSDDRQAIRVRWNEPIAMAGTGVGAELSILDWNVEIDGERYVVTSVTRPQFDTVVLTTLQTIPCDIGSGVLEYEPNTELGTVRFHDRVGQNAGDQAEDIIDGILPDAPLIDEVRGQGLQDGKFWFNTTTPEVGLIDPFEEPGNPVAELLDSGDGCRSLADGYQVELFEDTTGDGEFDPAADKLLARVDVDGDTALITEDDYEAGFEGVVTDSTQAWFEAVAFARSLDTNGLPSAVANVNARKVNFVLDTKDPTFAPGIPATVSGNDVTVTLSEASPFGRNFALDWIFAGRREGETRLITFGIESVSVPSGAESRVLHVDPNSEWGPSMTPAHVEFQYLGPAENRITDRAGNFLADGTVEF